MHSLETIMFLNDAAHARHAEAREAQYAIVRDALTGEEYDARPVAKNGIICAVDYFLRGNRVGRIYVSFDAFLALRK